MKQKTTSRLCKLQFNLTRLGYHYTINSIPYENLWGDCDNFKSYHAGWCVLQYYL